MIKNFEFIFNRHDTIDEFISKVSYVAMNGGEVIIINRKHTVDTVSIKVCGSISSELFVILCDNCAEIRRTK